jgi:sulfate transport system ATP-binding protein
MDFLGHVNVFHGRVENGQARLTDIGSKLGWNREAFGSAVYVRPHELEIHRGEEGDGIRGTVRRIHLAGACAKVVVASASGNEVVAEVSFDRFHQLALQSGETVFVSAKKARVFTPDYEI